MVPNKVEQNLLNILPNKMYNTLNRTAAWAPNGEWIHEKHITQDNDHSKTVRWKEQS